MKEPMMADSHEITVRNYKQPLRNRLIMMLVCIGIALASFFVVSKWATSVDSYRWVIKTLNGLQKKALGLSGTATALATGAAAIPGEATTPIANKLADVAGYMVIVYAVIIVEKYLLTITGYIAFKILFPIGCVLLAAGNFLKNGWKEFIYRIGIKSIILGVLLWGLVPTSAWVTNMVNETYAKSYEADFTLVYTKAKHLSAKDVKKHILLDINDEKIVTDMHVYPSKQKTDCSYMHMFITRRELLMDMVEYAVTHGRHTISKDILLTAVSKGLKVSTYEFSGYKKKIDSIQSYYCFNLDLLKKDIRDELFGLNTNNPIFTKIKDTVPTKYSKSAEITNSFIADGCKIEGTVKNSILFRGVHVAKGATVENCILMQNSEIMENCLLENVIFDKGVILRSGKKLVGQDTYPMVIGKEIIV